MTKGSKSEARKPIDITLVRSRIFYAKPSLTAQGLVQPGYKHIRKYRKYIQSNILLIFFQTC
jgi:hypothetical protein